MKNTIIKIKNAIMTGTKKHLSNFTSWQNERNEPANTHFVHLPRQHLPLAYGGIHL